MPNVSRKKQKERKERNIMRKSGSQKGKSPSRMIDERIKELGDWRGKKLSPLPPIIKQNHPPGGGGGEGGGGAGWGLDGLCCTRETDKQIGEKNLFQEAGRLGPS